MGRTPSAWLLPGSNRITLRVTTSEEPDIGVDSITALAPHSWNHVAFSFDNATEDAFSATIFVNGIADVSVTFRDMKVRGNDGPLHIGRDPSNVGPRRVESAWIVEMPSAVNTRVRTLRARFSRGARTVIPRRTPYCLKFSRTMASLSFSGRKSTIRSSR